MTPYIVALLQAATVQAPPVATMQTSPIIWRDFREGVSPEQFAEGLRKIDGIKAVEVTRKGTKPAKIKITYSAGGALPIGALNVAVNPTFVKNGLSSVELTQTGCLTSIAAEVKETIKALSEKYGSSQNVSVVGDDGATIEKQRAFYNPETRVTIGVTTIDNPYPEHVYGGTGFVGAANKLAKSMADSNYNSANEACPVDKGRKGTFKLVYVSQAAFLIDHSKEEAARRSKSNAMKDGL